MHSGPTNPWSKSNNPSLRESQGVSFSSVIKFETNDALKDDVVVHRRCAVHPRFIRIRPWLKHSADKFLEFIARGR